MSAARFLCPALIVTVDIPLWWIVICSRSSPPGQGSFDYQPVVLSSSVDAVDDTGSGPAYEARPSRQERAGSANGGSECPPRAGSFSRQAFERFLEVLREGEGRFLICVLTEPG